MSRRAAALLRLLTFAGAACATTASAPRHAAPVDLLATAPGRVRVLVFTSHECPIANSYAPTLRALASRFAAAPVDWFLVHVDPDLTDAAAAAHARDYDLPGTVVREPAQAAVLVDGALAYRGRIDDQWAALGIRRAEAGQSDLADAIVAVLAGRAPAAARTTAVGCLLPEPLR
jgi:hypothetical protein